MLPLNVISKSNLLSQVKYLCSQDSDGNIQLWFGEALQKYGQENMLFCPSADSYDYLSVQHPPWLTPLYSAVLPLILKDQVEEL